MASQKISMWLDTTSEGREAAKWIVSIDGDDTTTTLSVHEDREDALTAAQAASKAKGLPLVEEAE